VRSVETFPAVFPSFTYACRMGKWGVLIAGLFLVGCVAAPTGGGDASVEATVPVVASPTESLTPTMTLLCQAAGTDLIGAIKSQFDLRGYGPFNPSIVVFDPFWEIVAFGYGGGSLDAYLARRDSLDAATWVRVVANDVDHWEDPRVPPGVAAAGRPAAQLAIQCTMGG